VAVERGELHAEPLREEGAQRVKFDLLLARQLAAVDDDEVAGADGFVHALAAGLPARDAAHQGVHHHEHLRAVGSVEVDLAQLIAGGADLPDGQLVS
jgi:hypothetical protein